MKRKIELMIEMQDKLNIKTIGADWKAQRKPWDTAIFVESAEALDHYGYKWWAEKEPDIEQTKLELVDIWHFALSWAIQDLSNPVESIEEHAFGFNNRGGFVVVLKHCVLNRLSDSFSFISSFPKVCGAINLGFDELFNLYIAKNALNEFRQLNGYKDGSYRKVWLIQ
jgi:dimeric dUTPase (all-alpha-NTP-PPase superfamily)